MIPDPDSIVSSVQAVIKMQIEEAVKIAINNAKYELDRRIPEIVAGIAIHAMKRISMESLRDEIVIHIRMEK